MSNNMENRKDFCRHQRRPSSFWMQNPEMVFQQLGLMPGYVFLDLGCGAGEYSLKASQIIGGKGLVYAFDIRKDLIQNLLDDARTQCLDNIKAMQADITAPFPLKDATVDVCLLSTVLHIFQMSQIEKPLFKELRRVLKPKGLLGVIECKKQKQSFGPPLEMRLASQEIEQSASKHGFIKKELIDLGYNYMLCLVPGKTSPD